MFHPALLRRRRQGGSALTNIITNGTFDADSDWVKSGGWSIGGGVASAAGPSAGNFRQDAVAIAARGVDLRVDWEITARTGGAVAVYVQQVSPSVVTVYGIYRSAVGEYSDTISVPANALYFGFTQATFVGSIDNVRGYLV